MAPKSKRLRVMAGPNGSGKSTILQEVRKNFNCGPFVNADEIEVLLKTTGEISLQRKFRLKEDKDSFNLFMTVQGKSWKLKAKNAGNSINIQYSSGRIIADQEPSPYDAALAADFIRYRLLAKGVTFTFETVLSHPSKIEFLKQSKSIGYKNYLYFICTVDPVINIERVKIRVQQGGHGVPEGKIVKRYYDSLNALNSILPFCHRAYFFDNSTETLNIEPIAEVDRGGKLIIFNDIIPSWLDKYVIQRFPAIHPP